MDLIGAWIIIILMVIQMAVCASAAGPRPWRRKLSKSLAAHTGWDKPRPGAVGRLEIPWTIVCPPGWFTHARALAGVHPLRIWYAQN